MPRMWNEWWKRWKPWALLILGLVVAYHGYTGSPTWYIEIGLAIAAIALWIALEQGRPTNPY
jgi:hypothetical protein